MSWNDERVDLLSRLWLDGRSASQIAAELGQGITRNAVIGKVHRLGLSGRAKVAPTTTTASRPRSKTMPKAEERPAQAIPVPIASEVKASLPAARPTADVVVPFSTRVTIMDLRETMCRWPLGDPTSPDFRYCGSRTGDIGPYCCEHARLAFQPTQDRRRIARIA